MTTHPRETVFSHHEPHVVAAELLSGLELLRWELGSVAEELIALLRKAGIRPPGEPDRPAPSLH